MTRDDREAITAYCPACDTRIRFSEGLRVMDVVMCPECEELFEVVGVSPVRLHWAEYRRSGDEEAAGGDDTGKRWPSGTASGET